MVTPPTLNNSLHVNNLSVSYGSCNAVHNVSFSLETNKSIIGLFGQNGAGKTTLLKTLAGFTPHFSGTITLPRHNNRKADAVFLPDKPYLYNFLTIDETIKLFHEYFSDFSTQKALEIVQMLNLDKSKKVGHLSKGMNEQISLGLMLARQSSLYLFDEPLAAVDPLTRDIIIDIIKTFLPTNALAIISTHLIFGLEDLFDEYLIMHEGSIVSHNSVSHISHNGGLEEVFKEAIKNV